MILSHGMKGLHLTIKGTRIGISIISGAEAINGIKQDLWVYQLSHCTPEQIETHVIDSYFDNTGIKIVLSRRPPPADINLDTVEFEDFELR